MQVRDVTEHAVDRLGGRPALSLSFRQSEGVPVEPHEEQERVVLTVKLEVLVGPTKFGGRPSGPPHSFSTAPGRRVAYFRLARGPNDECMTDAA